MAKHMELQEIQRLRMELYNMSPRSFYGFNKKMVFLQGTARLFFENYKRLED